MAATSRDAKEFWGFVDRIRTSGLPAHARHIALEIWLHMRPGRMVCGPSIQCLAANTGLSDRTVQANLKRLSESDLFDVEFSAGGRKKFHTYIARGIEKTAQELHRLMPENPESCAPCDHQNPETNAPFDTRNPENAAPLEKETPKIEHRNPENRVAPIEKLPLEATKSISPPTPPRGGARAERGVDVQPKAIFLHFDGRTLTFDRETINSWAVLGMCPPETAWRIVEAEVRGWIADGKLPNAPSRWLQARIARRRFDDQIYETQARNGAPQAPANRQSWQDEDRERNRRLREILDRAS